MISRRHLGAQVLVQVLVQVLARVQVLATSTYRQVLVGKYLSARTCHKYLPTSRGLSSPTRTAFQIPSSGSQDRELENHAREVNITKPR